MRLVLLPPWADSILSLLRVLGLVFLLLRLADPRKGLSGLAEKLGSAAPSATAQTLVVALALVCPGLIAPASAQAQVVPDKATLEALRLHVNSEANCGQGGCVELPYLSMTAQGSELRIEAEVLSLIHI